MIKFYNETEEEPKYYSISDCGNFCYAKKKRLHCMVTILNRELYPRNKGESLKDLDKEYQVMIGKEKKVIKNEKAIKTSKQVP